MCVMRRSAPELAILVSPWVLLVISGCAQYCDRVALEPYTPDTSVRVIRRFFAENPLDRVNVFLYVSGAAPRTIGPLDPEGKGLVARALLADTHPIDTQGARIVGLAARGGVELQGPLYSINIIISSVGFDIGSKEYGFTNSALAKVLLDMLKREGALEGPDGERLARAVATGGDGKHWEPEPDTSDGIRGGLGPDFWRSLDVYLTPRPVQDATRTQPQAIGGGAEGGCAAGGVGRPGARRAGQHGQDAAADRPHGGLRMHLRRLGPPGAGSR